MHSSTKKRQFSKWPCVCRVAVDRRRPAAGRSSERKVKREANEHTYPNMVARDVICRRRDAIYVSIVHLLDIVPNYYDP